MDPTEVDASSPRAATLRRILWMMIGLTTFVTTFALLDSSNDRAFTLVFYGGVYGVLFGLLFAVRKGHLRFGAWATSLFFWVLTAFVTLFLGGMQGHNAASFTVVAMMFGVLVSPRAGLIVAVVSAAWCGVIAALEVSDVLPRAIAPAYSPLNAWTAVSVSIVLVTVLMWDATASLERSHARALRAAAERDEARSRSVQAQKTELVGNLASSIAHDFNNVLTVIATVSQVLRGEVGDKRGVAEMLDDVDDATSRATLLTRHLLSFARMQPVERTPVDLSSQVNELGPVLHRLLGGRIDVRSDVDRGGVVLATPVGLEQILLNLAVNARDAMPEGGTLSLSVKVGEREVRLIVADTGLGMDAATKEKIFAPFFTTKAQGTGLGLVTVKERVEQFEGSITVESSPGAGTRFEIRFPRIERAPRARPTPLAGFRPPTAPSSEVARHLLLVEDDPLVRRATTRVLEHAGFDVTAVTNGQQALALLEQPHDFVCVVSDVVMPILEGDALSAKLAVSQPDLPIVLMSGNRSPSAPLTPKRRFLDKPVPPSLLLATIEEVLLER